MEGKMGSQLTKEDLIKSIIKRLPQLTEDKLKQLSMRNLWEIDRKITWLIKSPQATDEGGREHAGQRILQSQVLYDTEDGEDP